MVHLPQPATGLLRACELIGRIARENSQLLQQVASYCWNTGGDPLTRSHFRLTFTSTRFRIVLAAAKEFAQLGITANVVNPGPVDTGWMDPDTRAESLHRQPGKSLGTPERIANIVAFLLSSDGAWINGQLIKADGGFSA